MENIIDNQKSDNQKSNNQNHCHKTNKTREPNKSSINVSYYLYITLQITISCVSIHANGLHLHFTFFIFDSYHTTYKQIATSPTQIIHP